MRIPLTFEAYSPELDCPPFPASVPGNVQLDYITAHPEFVGDINYGLEHKKMTELEPYTWFYRTTLGEIPTKEGECVWFRTEGIDYRWALLLDGVEFFSHEGMFRPVELNLTERLGDQLHPGAVFEIRIFPHPKLPGRPEDRSQAAQCCKPPVAYEWDWHPRVIPSGLWDDTFLETRDEYHIDAAEARYTLAPDLFSAEVTFTVDAKVPAEVRFFAPDGSLLFEGIADGKPLTFTVEKPELWWCRGMGKPNLYSYEVTTDGDKKTGTVGFRRVKLVMNEGAWGEPDGFPKSRSFPPAQIELNGVRVFAKGSNYVSQEIFTGTMTRDKYEELIRYAVEANMNIFRCWGGSGFQKEDFYDLCDRYGMMLWVEFPLACNDYYDSEHYLSILRQEAEGAILGLRRHPSIAIWCGGNELFNSWSRMTDQHLAIRLLNALTFELTPEIPFNPTSPLSGMKHGGYTFVDRQTGLDQFALFTRSHATAYTEFGIPGIPSVEFIESCIPEEELFPIERGGSWEAHHAFHAWGSDAWLELPTLARYGDVSSLEKVVETSRWLQANGYKAIFEEARRQKPYCAMAINWCWCEPWKCAVNNSLIAYPNVKKAGYYAVKDSLRDVVGTLRMYRFDYAPGSDFTAELWLLNDTLAGITAEMTVTAELCGKTYELGSQTLTAKSNANAKGDTLTLKIPEDTPVKSHLFLTVTAKVGEDEIVNRYEMVVM